jgi:hypothetical protein
MKGDICNSDPEGKKTVVLYEENDIQIKKVIEGDNMWTCCPLGTYEVRRKRKGRYSEVRQSIRGLNKNNLVNLRNAISGVIDNPEPVNTNPKQKPIKKQNRFADLDVV